jgi:hypothetical protein
MVVAPIATPAIIKCSLFDCKEKAIGRFKPDARPLCSEHGVKASQEWAATHPNKIGLIGIIVQ